MDKRRLLRDYLILPYELVLSKLGLIGKAIPEVVIKVEDKEEKEVSLGKVG